MSQAWIIQPGDVKAKQQVVSWLNAQTKAVRVEACQYRQRRTDRQNRFYWPCVVAPFAEFLREQGENVSDDDAHHILKVRHLPRRRIVNRDTGELIGYAKLTTTTLNTEEFNAYLDRCVAWLADMFGFVLPEPSQYHERDEAKEAAAA